MVDITAKNRILTLWKEGGYAYEKVKKEEYKQMYYAVLPQMDKGNAEWQYWFTVNGSWFMVHGWRDMK